MKTMDGVKTTHTQTPWVYGDLSESVIGPAGQPVAQFDYSDGRVPEEELRANVSLIVAAPDLLAASRAAAEQIQSWMSDNAPDMMDLAEVRDSLLEAIAKATR